jgi:hypothetical protein
MPGNRIAMRKAMGKAGVGIGRGLHLVALAREERGNGLGGGGIVFDEENSGS